MNHVTHHLFRPLKGGAAGVLVVFAILLSVCAKSLLGLPLALILISWFFKYAFILFDSTVRGFDEPPVLDINMMNPYGELRPVVAVFIIGGMAAITFATYEHFGHAIALAIGTLFLLCVPSSIAVLGLESSPLQAVSPVAWIRVITRLGSFYWLTLGLIATEFAAVFVFGKLPLGLVFQFAAGMFGTLSAFSLIAGALYERRDAIGLVTWLSPEQLEEKQRRDDHRQDEKLIAEAYGLMRTTRHQDSWQMLQTWLKTQGSSSEAYRWLTAQTDRWEDQRYSTRLAQEWVARLLTQRRPGQALDVVKERLRQDPTFRPKTGAETLSIAQLAASGGASPRTARILVSDFEERFPDDPRADIARVLTQQLS